MTWHPSIVGNFFVFLSIVAAVVTIRAYRHSFPGKRYFLLFNTSALIWTLTTAAEWFSAEPDAKAFWSQISYFGIVNATPGFFGFAMHYCGFGAHLTRRRVVLLWIVPVLTLIAALTNAVHGLNWPSYRMLEHLLGGYMYYEHGPSFWLLTAYSYLLNIASSILLLRQSTRIFRIYQTQSIVLFASVLIPWIGNILYNSRIITVVDLTPAAYIITGSLLLWNMLQFKLFDIVPIARDTLFEQLREIAIVLDAQQRIIDMNPAALKHFGITAPPSGSPAADVLHRWSELTAFIGDSSIAEAEMPFRKEKNDEEAAWFLLSRSALIDADERQAGTLIIGRNISAKKRTEREREELVNVLSEAVASVRTLSGLLPICASCKKIRDDEGYWNQVEFYISQRTDATFTHGICPECAAKVLEDFYRTKLKN